RSRYRRLHPPSRHRRLRRRSRRRRCGRCPRTPRRRGRARIPRSTSPRTSMTRGSELALVGLLIASPAWADTAAEKAFEEGRDLFRAGKYADACVRFEQSEQLDPQMGTLFNLAQCDEKIGKLASAIVAYREVVAKDNNAKRKAIAAEYAVTL